MLWPRISGTRTRFRQLRRVRWPALGNQNYREDPYEGQRWQPATVALHATSRPRDPP